MWPTCSAEVMQNDSLESFDMRVSMQPFSSRLHIVWTDMHSLIWMDCSSSAGMRPLVPVPQSSEVVFVCATHKQQGLG